MHRDRVEGRGRVEPLFRFTSVRRRVRYTVSMFAKNKMIVSRGLGMDERCSVDVPWSVLASINLMSLFLDEARRDR